MNDPQPPTSGVPVNTMAVHNLSNIFESTQPAVPQQATALKSNNSSSALKKSTHQDLSALDAQHHVGESNSGGGLVRRRSRGGSFSFHLDELSENDSDEEDPHMNVTYEMTEEIPEDDEHANRQMTLQNLNESLNQEESLKELNVMHK